MYRGISLALRTVAVAALLLVVLLAVCLAQAGAKSKKHKVTISGTAYAFDPPHPGINGATIRAKGAKGAKTKTAADGSYKLKVPDRSEVTPYIEAPGYHGIYLQTFKTDGKNLKRVNFQTPSDGIYSALAALLHVQLDASGDPAKCAIVSTTNTIKVRNLSFPDFIAFGAHGVAGATASTKPALPNPIYFDSNTIPDPSLTQTTDDGGVIWTEVPPDTYKVSASSPTDRFASFKATCKDGRIVNANPPWGLRQLNGG